MASLLDFMTNQSIQIGPLSANGLIAVMIALAVCWVIVRKLPKYIGAVVTTKFAPKQE